MDVEKCCETCEHYREGAFIRDMGKSDCYLINTGKIKFSDCRPTTWNCWKPKLQEDK